MKATAKKIENVKAMYDALIEKENEVKMAYDGMWVNREEGIYNVGRWMEWCKASDDEQTMEKKVRAAIRRLAKELGFEINKKMHLEYYRDMEKAISAIERQYNKAMAAFYDIEWYYDDIKVA